MLKPKKPTIPVRLELEYMLDQRRMATGVAQGRSINEQKLRLRLRHIAMTIAHQKTVEVAALIGRPVRFPSMDTINAWVEQEVKATLESPRQDAAREASQMQLMQELAKINAGQRERRASAAILSLNAGIIEEVAVSGGSSHYRWLTEQDSRVREWHADLEGTIQSWDDPPMGGGSHRTDEGHPGSGYGCRCLPDPLPVTLASAMPSKPRAEPVEPVSEIETGYKGKLKPQMTASEAIEAIKGHKTEHGMFWDLEGKPLARIKGSRTQIKFPDHAVKEMGGKPVKFIHNHPSGNPTLSFDDMDGALYVNIHEMSAVTASNGGMRMRVTDVDQWEKARRNRIFLQYDLKRAEKAATMAGRDALERVLPKEASPDQVYSEACSVEALKRYNEIGQRNGFTVERF